MSSLGEQQKAMIETAEQTKNLVGVISEHVAQLKIQHQDNVKSQCWMLVVTIVMSIATVVQAIGILYKN
jgi:hypothetical protein